VSAEADPTRKNLVARNRLLTEKAPRATSNK
jgi:hypothetical protein